MNGNALNSENLMKVFHAQQKLSELKLAKLKARQEKHPQSEEWNFYWFEQHFQMEYKEFIEGWTNKDLDNMLEELADMSNMIDLLAVLIIAKDSTVLQQVPVLKEQHDDQD